MNWYKISQQQEFDFWKSPENRNQYRDFSTSKEALPLGDLTFEESIEECDSDKELDNILKHFATQYKYFTFPNGVIVANVNINGNNILVVKTSEYNIKNPKEWVDEQVWSGHIEDYFPEQDFNKEFWEGVGQGSVLYHGTREDRLKSIMKNGLQPKDETRGFTNKGTGSAVFTSESMDTASYYYDEVLEIDLGKMKAEGYVPQVSQESPVAEGELAGSLAHMLGIEDYYYEGDSSDGLSPDTIIFYDAIPAKYLKAVK